jgi:hypothetical protein
MSICIFITGIQYGIDQTGQEMAQKRHRMRVPLRKSCCVYRLMGGKRYHPSRQNRSRSSRLPTLLMGTPTRTTPEGAALFEMKAILVPTMPSVISITGSGERLTRIANPDGFKYGSERRAGDEILAKTVIRRTHDAQILTNRELICPLRSAPFLIWLE